METGAAIRVVDAGTTPSNVAGSGNRQTPNSFTRSLAGDYSDVIGAPRVLFRAHDACCMTCSFTDGRLEPTVRWLVGSRGETGDDERPPEAEIRLQASIRGWPIGCPLCPPGALSQGGSATSLSCSSSSSSSELWSTRATLTAIIAVFTLVYLVAVFYRVYLFTRSSKVDALEVVTDEEALGVPEADLPFYTIMIPAYREASVIKKLIGNIAGSTTPTDRLEVLILVEADDDETFDALRTAIPPDHFKLVVVPPAEPRTKPKALNFGLTLARGDIVAVYDVEDNPDVLQLRRAAVALARFGPEVGCIQAKLSYGNARPEHHHQVVHHRVRHVVLLLPSRPFVAGCPIPLGGTSNHFRRSALRALGGWDPYNVTEDCDLGIRMFREGYDDQGPRVGDAGGGQQRLRELDQAAVPLVQGLPSDVPHPPPLSRQNDEGDSDGKGVGHLCAFVGGTPILAVLNPFFWVMTIVWFVAQPRSSRRSSPPPSTTSVFALGLRELPARGI